MRECDKFLKEIKEYFKYNPNVGTVKSETFSEMTKNEIVKLNIPKEEKVNLNIDSDYLVLSLYEEVRPILEKEELKSVTEKVAFGKIMNTTLNAFCIKEKDCENYAVVINEGLMTLLHKFGKLLVASKNPDHVAFCNRKSHKSISSKEYFLWAQELIDNYKNYNSPVGAMIKLNENGLRNHGMTLHIQEAFILCHELGHFFNGDLDDKKSLINIARTDWEIHEENVNHTIEYKADSKGFDLLEKAMNKKWKIKKQHLLAPLTILFDVLSMINPESSNSHPSPISRIVNIIEHNFGKDLAEDYLRTYESQ